MRRAIKGGVDLLAKEVNKLVLNDGSTRSQDKEPPAEAAAEGLQQGALTQAFAPHFSFSFLLGGGGRGSVVVGRHSICPPLPTAYSHRN